jgi:hypothetical protein
LLIEFISLLLINDVIIEKSNNNMIKNDIIIIEKDINKIFTENENISFDAREVT